MADLKDEYTGRRPIATALHMTRGILERKFGGMGYEEIQPDEIVCEVMRQGQAFGVIPSVTFQYDEKGKTVAVITFSDDSGDTISGILDRKKRKITTC